MSDLSKEDRRRMKRELAVLSGVGVLPEPKKTGGRRIARMSAKRAATERNYQNLRRSFLRAVYACEIRVPGHCTVKATQIQHVVRRSQAPEWIDDPRNFCATCADCHHLITHDGEWVVWAKANGFDMARWQAGPLMADLSPDSHGPAGRWTERLVTSGR